MAESNHAGLEGNRATSWILAGSCYCSDSGGLIGLLLLTALLLERG